MFRDISVPQNATFSPPDHSQGILLRLSPLRYFQNKNKPELQKSRDASVMRACDARWGGERELQHCWKGGGNKDGGVTPLKVKHFHGSTRLRIAPSAARGSRSAR
ncbi:hypothetical protein QQF64_018871 [Cirrhinus molitorella]|uniref:Uncharacterized protein n=1 Tax=Cirrhinus molitorella TaxID=172907 RepID=A0ABR3LDX9_9TELE